LMEFSMSMHQKGEAPDHRPGLPGKEITFLIVSPVVGSYRLDHAGHLPVKSLSTLSHICKHQDENR
jgi:hypothetical protein